jgi:hypothetical protein
MPGNPSGNVPPATHFSFPLLLRRFGLELERFNLKVKFFVHQIPPLDWN